VIVRGGRAENATGEIQTNCKKKLLLKGTLMKRSRSGPGEYHRVKSSRLAQKETVKRWS